jgi:hypothetical protein
MIDKETFENRKRGLLGERRTLLDQVSAMSLADLPRSRAFKKLELASAAYSGYISGNIHERRSIVEQVTSNLVVHRNTAVITLKSPFQEIVEWRKSQNGAPRRDTPRRRASKLLDIIVAVDNKEESTAVNDSNKRGQAAG